MEWSFSAQMRLARYSMPDLFLPLVGDQLVEGLTKSWGCSSSVFSCPCTKLMKLVQILFNLLWADTALQVHCKVCWLHPSEGSLRISSVQMCQHTLWLSFLGLMCSQNEGNSNKKKENLLSLRSECEDKGRPTGYPELTALFIISVGMLWISFHGLLKASVTSNCCLRRHYIMY